jgi:hypothetical protein
MFDWQLQNLGVAIYLFIIWEAFWKGIGLWKSAKKGDTLWFIAIFLINFVGLLPIFYLWRTKQLEPFLKECQHLIKSKFKKN